MWKLILFLGIFTLATNGVLSDHEYYLDNHCGDTISTAFYTQSRLRFSIGSFIPSGNSCTVTFRLSSHHYMLYFKDINIQGYMGVCSRYGWLEVHDGSSKSSSSLTSNTKLCGDIPPSGVYRSTYSDLTFYFTSGRSHYSRNPFDIILTPYHTGYCSSYEYGCNNGRCISNSLSCSGYNSCGDNSDCETTKSVGGVAGGVIGGVLGGIAFVICVVIAVLVFRRRRAIIVRQPVGVSTVSATVTPPPYTTGYSQPPPQPYPQPYPQPAQPTVQYPQPVSY